MRSFTIEHQMKIQLFTIFFYITTLPSIQLFLNLDQMDTINNGGGFSSAIRDIVTGSIAGAIGKLIEYPFDTIKVRLQTQESYMFPDTWSCIKYTYKNEGILHGFFQGIESPLIGAALENAILFLSYNQCASFLAHFTTFSSFVVILISATFAGSCASFVLTPIELIKCKLQISNLQMDLSDEERHTSIIPTIKHIVKERGILGLWQGQSSTFIRESIGSMIWFATYELMKRSLRMEKDSNDTWELLISGAIAGLAFNGTVFPADTVKSIMQTEHTNLKETVQNILDRYGVAGFYRGLGITLIRAIPSNAAIFFTYEKLTKLI
ncbi:Ort1p NDAI_0C01470 [Naumovozyma dairenensis CBS 421]|uniref:Uncharacterized protein n=1 Tax=Naumovozyma dairenensis (strain ATCC 10597 / BCRC 20456 / CBS 421 / NBRC 0211 / NRRL Y-12639) TaxID=1071378 RepID=G0W7P7_NAUDC|nr:hypothetical protein NDAI_0C01470 [Naumovozyma dairenensis CBS 421]CCD23808.1 hypothetical protein NDAI_0C01470 [Naumovozyma dairenensis CBS 421]